MCYGLSDSILDTAKTAAGSDPRHTTGTPAAGVAAEAATAAGTSPAADKSAGISAAFGLAQECRGSTAGLAKIWRSRSQVQRGAGHARGLRPKAPGGHCRPACPFSYHCGTKGPKLEVTIDTLHTNESIWHRYSYEANIAMTSRLESPSGRVCWQETTQGAGNNYGYSGSLQIYQQMLNSALDMATLNLAQLPGFREALCKCSG